jgi:glutamine amidotransferase-like uncharacterized protein
MTAREEKVPGGKLVKVTVDKGNVILSGDFFIHPEEGAFLIERELSGLSGHETIETIEAMLSRLVKENGIELIGLDERVIARLYKGALHVASHRA